MAERWFINFADGNGERANIGGFFRADCLADVVAIAGQLLACDFKVWIRDV